jgi:hypothetical protein
MTRRDEIERILHDDLERARAFYDSETAQFRAATNSMTASNEADPDGTPNIRAAGTERRAALEAYSAALKRFNNFIMRGVVPDDLKG